MFNLNVAKTHFHVANIFSNVAKRPLGNVHIGRQGASTAVSVKSAHKLALKLSTFEKHASSSENKN
jgi:hypothetical protein